MINDRAIDELHAICSELEDIAEEINNTVPHLIEPPVNKKNLKAGIGQLNVYSGYIDDLRDFTMGLREYTEEAVTAEYDMNQQISAEIVEHLGLRGTMHDRA